MEINKYEQLNTNLQSLLGLVTTLDERLKYFLSDAYWQQQQIVSILNKQILTYSEIRGILVALIPENKEMIEKFDRLLFDRYFQVILYEQCIKAGK